MTDARFLTNNSVTREANHLKCKTLMQDIVGSIKSPKTVEIGQRIRPCWTTIYQKVEICAIWGPRSHPREPIGVKVRVPKRTHVLLGCAKFHVNQCNESPCGAKMLIFDLEVNLVPAKRHPADRKERTKEERME